MRWFPISRIAALVTLCVLVAVSSPAAPPAETAVEPETLQIMYLANEGFFLRSGDTSVLIDALFRSGLFGYDALEAEQRQRLESAQPPYDTVDLVLASHFHGDHFNAPAVRRFLQASPATRFVSTEHAVQKLLRLDDGLTDRARGVFPAGDHPVELDFAGIELTLFNLHHGRARPKIQNLGLLVTICGTSVLHIGDTEATVDEMRTAGLQDLEPDVALLPSWYLRPGRWMPATRGVIKPGRIVAMHLPTDEAPPSYFWGGLDSRAKLAAAIRSDFPHASIPLVTGTTLSVTCRGSSS